MKGFSFYFWSEQPVCAIGHPDFHSSEGLDHKPAAHHSFFPDPSLSYHVYTGKELVCTQNLSDIQLGESKNKHLDQSKFGSTSSLELITLI